MYRNGIKSGWITVMMLAGMASISLAQDVTLAAHTAGHAGRGGYGFKAQLVERVGLNPEQRDAVNGLFAAQRQKTQELREETNSKIRAILNQEQQRKFDTFMAEQKKANASRKAKGA